MYKLRLKKFVNKAYNDSVPECMDSLLLRCVNNPYELRSRSKHHVTVSHFNTGYMKQSIHCRGSISWNRMIDVHTDSIKYKAFL